MFARTAARTTLRQARQPLIRQQLRGAHTTHTTVTPTKSDLPWIIGSALVFVPLFFTLTSPPEALKHATSVTNPNKHQDVPSSHKATLAEDPKDKESSPSHAAAKKAAEADEASEDKGDAEKAQPAQEGKDEDKVAEGKEEDTTDAPTPAGSASGEEKQEGSNEAKAAAKESQPGKQEKMNDAIAESKEEESKKDSE